MATKDDDDDLVGSPKAGSNSDGAAQGQLKSIVERIERLNEEKKEVAEQIKEVFAESKANGFDAPTIRRVLAARKKDPEQRQEEEALFDLYLSALGMLPD